MSGMPKQRPYLVTLPGIDGSPALQGALPHSLHSLQGMDGLVHQLVSYPPHQAMGYADLARWVQPQLPNDRPFVLLGESFGGPLALLLAGCGQGNACMKSPPQLKGVVLAASFAGPAVPWAAPWLPLIKNIPARSLHAIPAAVWHWWLLGRWATPALQAALKQALGYASPHVLQHRAVQALQPPKLSMQRLRVPLLAIRAAEDRLVPPASVQPFAHLPHSQTITISGPHMLLQTVSDICAPPIAAFMQKCCGNPEYI